MKVASLGAVNADVALVHDETYPQVLRDMIRNAQTYLFASVFIVEICPARDPDLMVDGVLRMLRGALWRGVDVRLIIGGSRNNLQIAEISLMAESLAKRYALPAKWLTKLNVQGSHAKFVVADNRVLLGSHNWSPGAFSGQVQDSVFLRDQGIASRLREIFLEQWER